MLKIGVQTKGIIEAQTVMQGFAMIKRAGFDCVDVDLDLFLTDNEVDGTERQRFFEQSKEELEIRLRPYKTAMEMYGIVPSHIHVHDSGSIHETEKQKRFREDVIIPESLAIAGLLQIPYVVVPPVKVQYLLRREEEVQQNTRYFQSLIPWAKENQVMICLKNLYEDVGGRIVEGACADPAEVVSYLEELNEYAGEECFGFCLDIGHVNLVGRDMYDTIKALGKYIKVIHLHDNDAKGDLHQMPFTFRDIDRHGFGVNWERVIKGLREISYDGVLNFDVFPCMKSFPPQVAEQVLGVMAQTGRYVVLGMEKSGR